MRGPSLETPGRNCPCNGCKERYMACSGNCPKDARGEFGYKAWKAELDRVKANMREWKNKPFSPIK